jgi:hypothetical protein
MKLAWRAWLDAHLRSSLSSPVANVKYNSLLNPFTDDAAACLEKAQILFRFLSRIAEELCWICNNKKNL